MKLAALISLMAWVASAQSYEIRGVLLEKATERPVKGLVRISPLTARDGEQSVEANVSGEFRAQVRSSGSYTVSFGGSEQFLSVFTMTELTADKPSASVRLLADRLGRVSGRVLDDATGEPLIDVPVTMMQVRWIKGQIVTEEHPVRTDTEGRFQGSGGQAWPWVVAVMPRLVAPTNEADYLMTTFTKEDVEATDEDYEERYWPGGVRALGEAVPAPYTPDQTTNVGNLRVRKMEYRRALLHFPAQGCDKGVPFRAKFVEPRDELRDFTLLCGQDLLLKGLITGTRYRLEIGPTEQIPPAAWRTGVLEFVVGDRNPELRVSLTPGVDLQGRVVFAEGSEAPKKPLQLTLRQGNMWQERRVDREGRFKFENVQIGDQVFFVFAEGSHYARSVRINGVDTYGVEHKFNWMGQGTLEVVVDDQPSAVAGTVTDGVRTVAPAKVVVVQWPIPTGKTVFDMRFSSEVDGAGRYRIDTLPPGEYRVVAVRGEFRSKLEEPGLLERLFAGAEKVTLGRGTSATLDVRVVELK